jgi:DNA end-binding protein Ku
MHFADELADPESLDLPGDQAGKKEMALAEQLINSMSEQWEPEKLMDEYHEALTKLIEEKVSTPGKAQPSKVHRRASNVVDLMDVLRESLESQKQSKPKKAKTSSHASHRKAA